MPITVLEEISLAKLQSELPKKEEALNFAGIEVLTKLGGKT